MKLVSLAALFFFATSPAAHAEALPDLRHTLGVDVGGGAWFGGAHATIDARYGYDIIPFVQVGAVIGASVLDDPAARGVVYGRVRFLRGGDEHTFVGHALVLSLGFGVYFDAEYYFVEPALGWEFRHVSGFGIGIDSGLIHSLTDESGWPFARLRLAWSF